MKSSLLKSVLVLLIASPAWSQEKMVPVLCPMDVPASEVLNYVDQIEIKNRVTIQIGRNEDLVQLGDLAFKNSTGTDEQVSRRIYLHESNPRKRQMSPTRPVMIVDYISDDNEVVILDDQTVASIDVTRQMGSGPVLMKELVALWADTYEISCTEFPVLEASAKDANRGKGRI